MGMVVQCKSCMTEYRLNEALLKGAKGACIRCPKCRERILVENPQAPQAAPSITQRVTPPVVTPPIMPRVEPPAAPLIPQRIPPPIGSPVPPSTVPPLASRVVPRLTPPAVRQIAPAVAHPPIAPPRMSRVAPPVSVETGTPSIRDAAVREMTMPVPRDRRVEEADLSDKILPEPVVGVDDGIVVSSTPDTASDPPEFPGRNVLRLEELFIHPSAVEECRVTGGREEAPMKIRPAGPEWNPPARRPRYRRPLFLAAAISLFLVVGGAFYFVDGNSGRTSPGNVLPVRPRSALEKAVFDVGNLKGSLNRQASGEPLYVVKGTVTNVGKTLSSGIHIEATLLGRDNQVIVKNGAFAGNVIDESLIPHMTRVRIEGFLGMRHGDGDVNRDIPAGKTLPFMVVFFDPPGGVDSFRVKAIEADEADRVNSPDGGEPGTRASNPQPIRLN